MPRKTKTRDQHRPLGLLEDRGERAVTTAPEVFAEVVGLEGDDGDDDEHQDRNDLGDRRDPVDDGGFLYAP
jgi:hypothetical protein